jgi:hypothetical protein
MVELLGKRLDLDRKRPRSRPRAPEASRVIAGRMRMSAASRPLKSFAP